MRALRRVALADLRHRKLSAFLLVAVVVVATAGIVAGLGQQRGAEEQWDDAFDEANGAHVALYGSEAALRGASRDAAVVQSAGPYPVEGAAVVHRGGRIEDVDVRGAEATRPAVGTPLLYEGRWLDGSGDEVVVERSLALEEGLATGDRVRLDGRGGEVRARVVGVALDLLDCFYPDCDSAMVWSAPATVDRLAGPREPGALVLLRLRDPEAVGRFESRAQDALGAELDGFADWKDTRADTLRLNQFFGAFLASFGVMLLLAAALVVLGTVSARVLARYRELGILKAIGCTPRSLTLLVLVENLLLALAGAAVGCAIGVLLAPSLQLDVERVFERGTASVPADLLALAIVLVLGIVAVATLAPALRAGRVPATRAITRGAAPASTRPSRLARLAATLRLGTPAVVGVKDLTARPLRTWLTIATLAVTVIAVVANLSLQRTVDRFSANPALAGDPFDLVVDPGEASPARVRAALRDRREVETWFTATDRQGAVGDATFLVRALGDDVAHSGFEVKDGRLPRGPGEAIAPYGLLQLVDRDVGDRLPLELGGRRLDVRIVGRYLDLEDTGELAMITLADLRTVEPRAPPGAFLVHLRDGADPPAVARGLAATLGPGSPVEVAEADTDDLDAFGIAFNVVGLLVLAVALVNLFASTTLGVREHVHDIGILKAVGLTPRQVAWSVAVGCGATALAAVLLGVPAGILAARAMNETVGRNTGQGAEFGVGAAAPAVVVAALVIVALAMIVGALVARRAARAPAAEVLRAE